VTFWVRMVTTRHPAPVKSRDRVHDQTRSMAAAACGEMPCSSSWFPRDGAEFPWTDRAPVVVLGLQPVRVLCPPSVCSQGHFMVWGFVKASRGVDDSFSHGLENICSSVSRNTDLAPPIAYPSGKETKQERFAKRSTPGTIHAPSGD
jgi:hypothetical protein